MRLDDCQTATFLTKYSRFRWDQGRREVWGQSVDRVCDEFLWPRAGSVLDASERAEIRRAILEVDVMSAMRVLAMAGSAIDSHGACAYNCSYLPIDSIYSFVEALIIGMCGSGVGYSVERRYVDQLPMVEFRTTEFRRVVVEDSAEGWASAYHEVLQAAWRGAHVEVDASRVRPKGAPIRGRGGRSSGPECFLRMVEAVLSIIEGARGRKLDTVEAHDIMLFTGRSSSQGDVRQIAHIALFDFDDQKMLHCKDPSELSNGRNSQRYLANNSAVWPDRELGRDEIDHFVHEMAASYRGEPGIFSRRACEFTRPERRASRDDWGANPCCEIVLRPRQFCNLSMAIVRPTDTMRDLIRKVRLAAKIGVIQSMELNFPWLPDQWRRNCEEERLIGVDLPGYFDRPLTGPELRELKVHVLEAAFDMADRLGIPRPAAATTGKPCGNSSEFLQCSPGIANPRFSKYQIRRHRYSPMDPVAQLLMDSGVPYAYDAVGDKICVEYPRAAPAGTLTADDITAIQHLEIWKTIKLNWTEHNPSVTVEYRPGEVESISAWLHNNQAIVGGLSFLPKDEASYELMPNERITREEYERRRDEWPIIDWSKLDDGGHDYSGAFAEKACVNNACAL